MPSPRPSCDLCLVDLERLCLAAGTVEGEHQLPSKALLQWVTRDKRLQLADQVVLQAERKIGVDPFNQSAQAKLLQPPDLVESERLIGEVGQRRAAPQSERVAQERRGPRRVACRLSPLPLVETLLEAVNVQLASLNVECVTSRLGPQTVVAQCATQLRDVVLEDLRRRRGRPLTPKLVDQSVRRERLVRMDQQERQQRTLLATPERGAPR